MLSAAVPPPAWADLAVTGTRFVYPEGEKEIIVSLRNTGNDPVLVQTWLDRGGPESDLSRLQVPFVLMPPLFRVDPGQRKALQLRYTGEPLPPDRETVFWINLRHAPAKQDTQQRLQVVLSYVMKVLYRPKGLAGKAGDAPSQVRWSYHRGSKQAASYLQAENPTPYAVSLSTLSLRNGPVPIAWTGLTILPKTTERFALPAGSAPSLGSGAGLEFEAVDDLGLVISGAATLQAAAP
ncbi:fimbrial biogenesis chaperone [Achromobacter marplatensis]|uniref:fimbrial biogenesis chaperone n=1 Tax=Achromobacter marplatensis TaxID=470868 RepID=UPI0039F6AC5E